MGNGFANLTLQPTRPRLIIFSMKGRLWKRLPAGFLTI